MLRSNHDIFSRLHDLSNWEIDRMLLNDLFDYGLRYLAFVGNRGEAPCWEKPGRESCG